MSDFLEYTIEFLEDHNKTPEDVRWVGAKTWGGWFTWEDFVELTKNIRIKSFNPDYPAVTLIADDLIIVGDDWWAELRTIDKFQSWEFKQYPKKPEQYKVPNSLTCDVLYTGPKSLNRIELDLEVSELEKNSIL